VSAKHQVAQTRAVSADAVDIYSDKLTQFLLRGLTVGQYHC